MMQKFVSFISSVSRLCPAKISVNQPFGICGRLMSVSSQDILTDDHSKKWHLFSAVCLERLPQISANLNEIENKYLNFMNQLEIENSLLSDHELRFQEDKKIAAKKHDDSDLKEETARKTTTEIEDLWEIEYNSFTPAPRITEADKSNDLKSLERCLDGKLILLVKQKLGTQETWVMPQGRHQPGESMRQTAERILHQYCGEKMKSLFLGNAPCGYHKYKYPRDADVFGAKVFFFKAFHQDGNVSEICPEIIDYSWVTKKELPQYLSPVYLESVNKFIIDF